MRIVKPHSPQGQLYNRAHPLARGLVFGVIPGGNHRRDIVTGNMPSAEGTGSFSSRRSGIGGVWESTSELVGGVSWPLSSFVKSITTDLTMIVWIQVDSMPRWGHILAVPYDTNAWSNPYYCFGMNRNDTSDGIRLAKTVGTTHYVSAGTDAVLDIPTPGMVMAGETLKDTSILQYKNGVRLPSAIASITAGNIPFPSSATEVSLCARNSGTSGEAMDGAIGAAFIWNRALSDSEMMLAHRDPWGLLSPQTRMSEFLSAAAPASSGAPKGVFSNPFAGPFGGPI